MSASGSVAGMGATSPMGLDAVQTVMVWRAAKLSPRGLPWKDKRGRDIGSLRARAVPDSITGRARLVELAVPALREAVFTAGERLGGPPAIILATGEPRPGMEDVANRSLVDAISDRAKVPVDPSRCEVIGAGHAGFAIALQRALSLLGGGRAPAVIVGGVDTYHHPETLAWLDGQCRLHADDAPNGIIPSEGAAFLVLTATSGTAACRVSSVACAMEEGSEEGVAPDLARALQDVVKRATAGRALPMKWVMTDCNGERHRVRRISFVKVRERAVVAPETLVLDAADEIGDTGAAVGALLAVRAAASFASGAAEADDVMVMLSSEGAERGAFVMEAVK